MAVGGSEAAEGDGWAQLTPSLDTNLKGRRGEEKRENVTIVGFTAQCAVTWTVR